MLVATPRWWATSTSSPAALISPNFAILESWARVKGVVYPAGDRNALGAGSRGGGALPAHRPMR